MRASEKTTTGARAFHKGLGNAGNQRIQRTRTAKSRRGSLPAATSLHHREAEALSRGGKAGSEGKDEPTGMTTHFPLSDEELVRQLVPPDELEPNEREDEDELPPVHALGIDLGTGKWCVAKLAACRGGVGTTVLAPEWPPSRPVFLRPPPYIGVPARPRDAWARSCCLFCLGV